MSDFWTKRLGNNTSTNVAPAPPTFQPAGLPGASYTPRPVQPASTNAKAPSSLSTKTCPECGSGNYTGHPGDPTKMIRCYDCGYNPRFGAQSGSAGMPSSQSKAATPARQVVTTSNYQPSTIVGRIGE